jgi:hypothetical protein
MELVVNKLGVSKFPGGDGKLMRWLFAIIVKVK